MVVARVLGVSLLTAGLGAGLGQVLFGPSREAVAASVVFGCIGAMVGALAGAVQELVALHYRKLSS